LYPPCGHAVACQHLLDPAGAKRSVLNHYASGNNCVAGGTRTATQPGLNRVGKSAGEGNALKGPTDQVCSGTWTKDADLACSSETLGSAERRYLQCVTGTYRIRPLAKTGTEHRGSSLEPQRSRVRR
jgi:hypothetical protein